MSEDSAHTVLVIDDENINNQILSDLLKDDVQVLLATNGEDGISIARNNHPDILLLDIMMPGMDGYEVCKRLKANPQTKSIPIIFVSAMDQMQDQALGLKMGAIDYIAKPYDPVIIKAKVLNHLTQKDKTLAATAAKNAAGPARGNQTWGNQNRRTSSGRRATQPPPPGRQAGQSSTSDRRAAPTPPHPEKGSASTMIFLALGVAIAVGAGTYWFMRTPEVVVLVPQQQTTTQPAAPVVDLSPPEVQSAPGEQENKPTLSDAVSE